MGLDWGYLIAGLVVFVISARVYKKSTGKDISELWKRDGKVSRIPDAPQYQRVYITRGIKT